MYVDKVRHTPVVTALSFPSIVGTEGSKEVCNVLYALVPFVYISIDMYTSQLFLSVYNMNTMSTTYKVRINYDVLEDSQRTRPGDVSFVQLAHW